MTSTFKVTRIVLSGKQGTNPQIISLQNTLANALNWWIQDQADPPDSSFVSGGVMHLLASILAGDPSVTQAGAIDLLGRCVGLVVQIRTEANADCHLPPCPLCQAFTDKHSSGTEFPMILSPGALGMCGHCGALTELTEPAAGSEYTFEMRVLTDAEIESFDESTREILGRLMAQREESSGKRTS